MNSGPSRASRADDTAPPRRPPRLVAGLFVAAFAASILTVIYTGLLVEAPRTRIAAGLPAVQLEAGGEREVNVVFTSSAAVDDVSLQLALPEGIELLGHEGERTVRFTTRLEEGNNILPLTLVAAEPAAGQLVARLRHGGDEHVFRIRIDASPRAP